jgi:hypothetical protein
LLKSESRNSTTQSGGGTGPLIGVPGSGMKSKKCEQPWKGEKWKPQLLKEETNNEIPNTSKHGHTFTSAGKLATE